MHGRDEQYHSDKMLACVKNGIRLLTFHDYEIKDTPDIVKSVIDREMLKCTIINQQFLKPYQAEQGELSEFLEGNFLGHAYCPHKRYFSFKDKKGLALVFAVRLEKTYEGSECLVVTDIVFRNGLYVLDWFKLLSETINFVKGFTVCLAGAKQPLLAYDLVRSGAKHSANGKPSYYWYKNRKLYHRNALEDTTGYVRIFDYGYAFFEYGTQIVDVDELQQLGFSLWGV